MDIAVLLFIVSGFLLGVAITSIFGWLAFQRFKQYLEKAAEQRCENYRLALESQIEDRNSKLDFDYQRKLLEWEKESAAIKLSLKAKEDEAVSALLNAEKDRDQLDKRRLDLENRLQELDKFEDKRRELVENYRNRLQQVADLDRKQAREYLYEEVRKDCEKELCEYRNELILKSEKELELEARRILIDAMQRLASVPQNDITATIVEIPSEDMKGRIIGREGRNIKSFESLTGTTLLIDETPDSVLISSFDPVRREIAKFALQSLIKDGRIHPSSIEESIGRAEEEVKKSVVESGEDALRRLKLGTMHPEVLNLIGKLRFRLSNNQNSLDHSIEVANLCALMAAELGLDPEIAKRSGLLHDIGKVLDQDHEGSHALAGAYFLKRFGEEDPRVINAVAAHHGEAPVESAYVTLVMMADSLSAMRPGARTDSIDGYVQRIRNLESIAKSMDGITDAYAIQAGREIRVIVTPETVSDGNAQLIARQIRRRIEDELQYPGTIKVTVIREQRFQEVAK
jgi:ribonuclease Y